MEQYLSHHGIDGMKWGIRRYQNEDGTRTPLGQRHRREIEGTEGTRETAGHKVKNFVKNNAGTIAKAALATAAIAGTAYLISRNKGAINAAVKAMSDMTVSSLNSAKSIINTGKNYVSKTIGKVGQTAKNIHNSKEATVFRTQAKKTGKKISDMAKDPRGREAAKAYAKAYAKGAADLGKTVGKTAAKVATKTGTFVGKRIEKAVDNAAKGKKPKFVKTKIALGTIAAAKAATTAAGIKGMRESREFEKQYMKDFKERQKEKYGR